MARTSTKIRPGSANLFADLGYQDADTHFIKARLVSRIQDAIDERGLTQATTGRLLGIGQPDVSRMLRGNFRDLSVERLMRFVKALGYEVDIIVRKKGDPSQRESIPLKTAGDRRGRDQTVRP
jgi:predicted XRE-type DNA-binding protein